MKAIKNMKDPDTRSFWEQVEKRAKEFERTATDDMKRWVDYIYDYDLGDFRPVRKLEGK